MITLKTFDNVSVFKKEVSPFLEQNEIENNLVLGVLNSLNEEDGEPPIFMAIAYRGEELVLTFLQTHPSQIIVSKLVSLSVEEIKSLSIDLYEQYPALPGFIGERALTLELARQIADKQGSEARIHMNQRIYRLNKVKKRNRHKRKTKKARYE